MKTENRKIESLKPSVKIYGNEVLSDEHNVQ